MKLKDMKPGQIYAYSRSREARYGAEPMVFLGAGLWGERRSGSAYAGQPAFAPRDSADRPHRGEWGHGSVGYPAAFLDSARGMGDMAWRLDLLRTASLEEMAGLRSPHPPPWDVNADEETLTEAQRHQNLRHRLLRYGVLTSPTYIHGEWEEFQAARQLRKEQERAASEQEAIRRALLSARQGEAMAALEALGIKPGFAVPEGGVRMPLESLEQVAQVLRWAQSRGIKHMDQFGT